MEHGITNRDNYPNNTPTYNNLSRSQVGRQLPAVIAVVVALIIFLMQLNWVEVNIDVSGLSSHMLADIVSQEDIWGGITPHNMEEAMDIVIEIIMQEVMEFIATIRILDHNINIEDILVTGIIPNIEDLIEMGAPPDLTGLVEVISELIVWEVTRVTGGIGYFTQSISISDMPNVIGVVELLVDMIAREGAGWGLSPEDMHRLTAATEPLETAELAVEVLRVVFVVVTLLLVVFIYLLIAGVRPACIFGQICAFIVFVVSGGFALALFLGNHVLVEALGGYVGVGVSWCVYGVLGLSVLVFVLVGLYRRGLG